MESYIVKFWRTKDEGYREQKEETVNLKTNSKCAHEKASKEIQKKYNLSKDDIVSITYV